jgi:hypothetical protein
MSAQPPPWSPDWYAPEYLSSDARAGVPATYVPEPYDEQQGQWPMPAAAVPSYGTVYPAPRAARGRGWVVVAAIAAVVLGFLAWRVLVKQHHVAPIPAGSGVTAADPTVIPPGAGVAYRSPAGHFGARFAHRPVERTVPFSVPGVTFTGHAVGDPATGTAVEGVDISPGMSAATVDDFLDGAMHGLTLSGALKLGSDTSTTFRGRPAREGHLTAGNGRSFTALDVVYGSERAYLLLAPAESFDALQSSFVALP